MFRISPFCRLLGGALLFALGACAAPVQVQTLSGLTLSVNPDGFFEITSQQPAFTFSGNVGASLSSVAAAHGVDGDGRFQQISFRYTLNGAATNASVRIYHDRPVAIFSTTLLSAANNGPLFPRISTYPQGMYKFGYVFSYQYQYGPAGQGQDSPWAYFDASGNTFIVSPASHFPIAANSLDPANAIVAGINAAIPTLPAGFTQETMLVVGTGINHTWDVWGRALTDLAGKIRPGNASDASLAALSYWTDSVSKYYYYFDPSLGYEGTLQAVMQDFAAQGLPVHTMQLDSWWYPKGNPPAWNNTGDGIVYGQYLLEPDPAILPDGLGGVHATLGVPLLVHARWFEPGSPIFNQ